MCDRQQAHKIWSMGGNVKECVASHSVPGVSGGCQATGRSIHSRTWYGIILYVAGAQGICQCCVFKTWFKKCTRWKNGCSPKLIFKKCCRPDVTWGNAEDFINVSMTLPSANNLCFCHWAYYDFSCHWGNFPEKIVTDSKSAFRRGSALFSLRWIINRSHEH